MAAQGLEEWLKAAADGAAEDLALDLDLAHARGALNLAGRRVSDESHLDSLHGKLLGHVSEVRRGPAVWNP